MLFSLINFYSSHKISSSKEEKSSCGKRCCCSFPCFSRTSSNKTCCSPSQEGGCCSSFCKSSKGCCSCSNCGTCLRSCSCTTCGNGLRSCFRRCGGFFKSCCSSFCEKSAICVKSCCDKIRLCWCCKRNTGYTRLNRDPTVFKKKKKIYKFTILIFLAITLLAILVAFTIKEKYYVKY